MPSIGHAFIDMLRAESHEFPRVPLAGFSEQRAHRLSNLAFERLAAGILSLQHASLQGATGRSFTPSSATLLHWLTGLSCLNALWRTGAAMQTQASRQSKSSKVFDRLHEHHNRRLQDLKDNPGQL